MRRLVYYVACTLDGFIARQDGSFQDCFLFGGEHFQDLILRFPETFPAYLRARLGVSAAAECFDTVLMGRHTYEAGLREGIVSPYAPMRQYVFSRTLPPASSREVTVHRGDPLETVRSLNAESGNDIWLCGGSKLAAALAPEIDELILKINPSLIGNGIPLFDRSIGAVPASLIEHRIYPNGFALARYSLAGAPETTR